MKKLYALVNKYGSKEEFLAHMDEWPRTIKKLIDGSEELKIKLGMACPIPEQDNEEFMGIDQWLPPQNKSGGDGT